MCQIQECVYSPDSKYIVSASTDKTLKVWSADSFGSIATLEGHTDQV
jgi:WD40 repeat protein